MFEKQNNQNMFLLLLGVCVFVLVSSSLSGFSPCAWGSKGAKGAQSSFDFCLGFAQVGRPMPPVAAGSFLFPPLPFLVSVFSLGANYPHLS